MSTSYQTSAKPRGRREGESYDKQQSLSRASSTASQRLTKIKTKSTDGPPVAHTSRPNSPALFMQRNRAYDTKPIDSDMISPKSSTASMKHEKTTHKHDGEQSQRNPSSPTIAKSVASKRSSESALLTKAKLGGTQSKDSLGPGESLSDMISTTPQHSDIDKSKDYVLRPNEQPSSIASTSSHRPVADMQPRVSDVREETFNTDDLEQSRSQSDEKVPSKQHPSESSELQAKQSAKAVDLEPAPGPDQYYPNYSYQPPTTTTPAMSPPQSPSMYHYSNFGASIPTPFPYTYMQQTYPNELYQPNFLPDPVQTEVGTNNSSNVKAVEPSTDANRERLRLLEKMSSVLPDINDLLDYYQGNHDQLSFKEFLIRSTRREHAEEVTRLQIQLSAKKEEYEKVIGKLISENIRLKQDAADQSDTINALRHVEREFGALQMEHETLKSKHQDVLTGVNEVRLSKEQLVADKLKQQRSLDDVKLLRATERELHDNQIADLREKHQSEQMNRDKEHKLILSKVQLELANLITKHTQQRKELEQTRILISQVEEEIVQKSRNLENAILTHEQELASKTNAMEEIIISHKNELDRRAKELAECNEKHDTELKDIHEAHKEQIAKVEKDAEQARAVVVQSYKEQIQQLGENFELERETHRNARIEHEETTKKHGELAELMTVWKTKHDEWQVENDKMNRILESLGHRNAAKGKGDHYFTARFEQLAQDIDDVSRRFFVELPILSPEHSTKIVSPFGLPDFMATTTSASSLRSLFAQYLIYRILHGRIFQPFLFSESVKNYDETASDTLLPTLSREIRRKSVRREAIWRQITLRAIYTLPDATEVVAAVARSTVHEILNLIQPLAAVQLHNALGNAIRHIVKAAIEVWRQVRMEIDNVTSSMPEARYTGHEEDDVLLQIRPHIRRESVRLEQISAPEVGTGQIGHGVTWVYLEGTTLRSDSPVILQRRDEIRTTSSAIE